MKKLISLTFSLLMILSLCACGNSSSETESYNVSLTDSDLEDIAAVALYYEILDKCESSWSSEINPDETRYEIGRIEETSSGYRVRGNFNLYNDYGQITTPYSDGSGSYEQTFEVTIDEYGNAEKCTIN